jgi:transcription elongation factor GreB
VFSIGVHPHSLGAPPDLRWENCEMRKGSTRKPQADEPATRGKNYITPSGLQRLKDEHRFLLTRDRPAVVEVVAWAAGNGDRSENADYQYGKRRLRQIDGRIRFLAKRIEAAEVVDPEAPRTGQRAMRAFFGATVRYANAAGVERVVSIVGTDEVDLNRNHISWVSPLGRALMKSAAGDSVVLEAPGGTEYLTVMEVRYERVSVEPFREPTGSEASVKDSRRRSPDEEEKIRHRS